MQQFDVVISGGAASGSVLALALSHFSQHKMRIAIVEKFLPNYSEQGGFDARSIALAYGSLQKMAKIQPLTGANITTQIEPFLAPIQQIEVSDQHHFGKTTFNAQELNLPLLGGVIELATFGKTLQTIIAQQTNIQLFCPNQIQQVERSQSACTLTLDGGEILTCQLVIAADGIQSSLATMCGVPTETIRDYGQSAIIANVEMGQAHNGCAFERFTHQGPFALLPLSGKMMSLVWCVKDPEPLLTLSGSEFCQQLQQQFGWQLGKFQRVGKRFAYPLASQKTQSHIHHRLAIVGNASQLLHPVAGQGFNLGLRDLFTLAEMVGNAFAKNEDIGAYPLLMAFDQERAPDQARIMRETSGLISLFTCEMFPVQILRNAGLLALSHCQPLRHFAAYQALGL